MESSRTSLPASSSPMAGLRHRVQEALKMMDQFLSIPLVTSMSDQTIVWPGSTCKTLETLSINIPPLSAADMAFLRTVGKDLVECGKAVEPALQVAKASTKIIMPRAALTAQMLTLIKGAAQMRHEEAALIATDPTRAEIEAQVELQAAQSFFTRVRTTLSRIAHQLANYEPSDS
ncbi:unnamed protein product [Linum trigynum]|uniref:Uncharacterized protein n=1 Tax=Linum trigynum TaxID=586398 RepID=A0AAV2GKT3_9ROSI